VSKEQEFYPSQVDPIKLFEIATKTATLADVLRADITKLEETRVSKEQLESVQKQLDGVHVDLRNHVEFSRQERGAIFAHASKCADDVEARCAIAVEQRVKDIGLNKFSELSAQVSANSADLDTMKKLAVKYGLYGGLFLTGGISVIGLIIYVVRGLVTHVWTF